MKRRDFLKATVPTLSLPLVFRGFQIRAYGKTPALDSILRAAPESDRVMVLIRLNGGNDGLNTVIPVDQYDNYAQVRRNIAIPKSAILPLTDATGIHPAMTGMHSMYNDERLVVVQNVGNPSPSFSHERAMDNWLTATHGDDYVSTGWVGRQLANRYPSFPENFPNAEQPHPLAIQIGSSVSTLLDGPEGMMGMAFSSSLTFASLILEQRPDITINDCAADLLKYIRSLGEQINRYNESLRAAINDTVNKSDLYPEPYPGSLSEQLKIVARLVGSGVKTRVYVVNYSGFDTHSGQVEEEDHSLGSHAKLLDSVSQSIAAFQDDLRLFGAEDRVVGMTFSEFGRRVRSNGSAGTDHGAAAPLFVFGSNVNPGIIGANPSISTSASIQDNVPMQIDFRSVYASLLKDWFLLSDSDIRSILFDDYPIIPIINKRRTDVDDSPGFEAGRVYLGDNYPNPVRGSTHIPFRSDGQPVRLSIFDAAGREIQVLINRRLPAGDHSVLFEAHDLSDGIYYYRLQTGNYQQTRPFVRQK